MVNELVTIGVSEGAERPILLSFTRDRKTVEGIVYDDGPGTRAIVRARDRGEPSLVLQIIDALVDEWGTNPSQTRIWFRIGVRTVSS